jgi:hypothetical protein
MNAHLMDGSGNVSIIYALANDNLYNQLYGPQDSSYEYKVDNNKIPFIGYKKDNNLVFYNAIGEVFTFENDSINNDINIT